MTSTLQATSDNIRAMLFQHIARYGMTTTSVLQRLQELQPCGRPRLKQQVRQLVRSGHIACAPLFRNREYLYLTGEGQTGPHTEVSKIRSYAMLLFCCLSDVSRDRLTISDFQQHFPDLYRTGRPLHYYMEIVDGRPHLGFMRIDTGGYGRWDRIIARARSDICRHELHHPFRQLIKAGQFETAILTATPQKATRIEKTLSEGRHPADTAIRVFAIPDLLPLVAPLADCSYANSPV